MNFNQWETVNKTYMIVNFSSEAAKDGNDVCEGSVFNYAQDINS